LFDSEINMVVSFLKDVEGIRIQPHTTDRWVSLADNSGQYSAKSVYDVLRGETPDDVQDGTFEELWKLKVPNKISAFAWRLLRDKLPTRANLRRRQIELEDTTCPLCRRVEETAGHLFFNCSKVLPVWWESLYWVSIVGVFLHNPKQHFLQHVLGMPGGLQANRWKWWWMALTWTIWRHRNNIIFSYDTFDANKVLDDAVFLLWTWLRNLEKDFVTHYDQWSSNISTGFSQ